MAENTILFLDQTGLCHLSTHQASGNLCIHLRSKNRFHYTFNLGVLELSNNLWYSTSYSGHQRILSFAFILCQSAWKEELSSEGVWLSLWQREAFQMNQCCTESVVVHDMIISLRRLTNKYSGNGARIEKISFWVSPNGKPFYSKLLPTKSQVLVLLGVLMRKFPGVWVPASFLAQYGSLSMEVNF